MTADEPGTPRHDGPRTPLWRRYLHFFGPRGVVDLDDELRFHIEMRVRDFMARGMSEESARAATAQRLGDIATARDACVTIATRRQRRMNRAQIMESLVQDVRFAFRSLGRNKGWAAVAVLTLALGIGANAAMFSVVNHLLLHPIPYPNADRIVVVFQQPSQGNNTGIMIPVTPMGRLVSAWRRDARSFESLEPYRTTDVTLQRPGETPRTAHTAAIMPSFVKFAGQRPIVGRVFTEDEAESDANVVLLSEGLWRAEYGADRGVVGKSITVNGEPTTIVGVLPAVFRLPRPSDRDTDLWLPLDLTRSEDDGVMTVGRLRPGISRRAAAAELDSITKRHEAQGENRSRFVSKLAGPDELVRYQDSLILLSAAVALVLLIACANVAHLLLARASTREREMAIRAALGAGTGRLFRQLLTESMLLSVAGCLGGLLIGWAGLRVLVDRRPDELSDLAAARMDGSTLLVTAIIAIVTGIVFGVIGAVQASRHSTHDTLKAGSLAASAVRPHGRARGLLVVTEMALCTVLLVGATLLLRSVIHLQTRDAGFDAIGLYSIDVQLPEDRYKTMPARMAFFKELTDRASRIPGVEGVTLASGAPPSSSFLIGALQIEGQPDPPAGQTAFIQYNGVQPEFFRLMRMRILQGTTFTDTSAAAAQALVNEGMARKHWPGQSAIGRTLRVVYNGSGEWKTIVGVASDALTQGLTADVGEPMLYLPGPGIFRPSVIVRTTGDAKMLPVFASLVSNIDPRLPPPVMANVEEAMRSTMARPRFTMFLLMVFTLVAVGLAAVGLYGVLAYTVTQRTREIGIRIALGASRRVIARSVMSQGLLLTALGAVIGLAAARWGVTLLGSMLYGIPQADRVSFLAGAAVLLLIAVVACLVPVRRAVAVDPLIAMRAE